MAIELEEVLREIGEPDCLEAVAPHWEDSMATLPTGEIEFLLAENIARYRSLSGAEPDVDSPLAETATAIRSSRAQRALIWHAVCTCYRYEDIPWYALGRWPSLRPALGESAALFYLLVGLDMVPRTIERHRELGIPEEVTKQTIANPHAFLQRFRDGNDGRPGIFRREVGWMRHNTAGELFRVGRFEYMHRLFREPYYAYRNRATNEVVLLAAEGSRFTSEGFADERAAEGDPGWWEAHRIVDGESVRGFPIAPYGRAVNREVTIDLREWREVVVPNETSILDVHIPVGGRMTPEAVGSSFRAAAEFFRSSFPEVDFAGFRCVSWILGPQLEEVFPPEANLVRFLREIYLYPVPSSTYDGLFFIFPDDRRDERSMGPEQLRALPERTSLQRRVKEHLLAGRPWRGGGMLFLNEELDRFGSSPYRSGWPPSLLSP